MAERTLMSFDWAIKKVLRHKENFEHSVLETAFCVFDGTLFVIP
jgi:hypothetical protein